MIPKIERLGVGDIGITQVLSVLEPIWQTTTETASRVRGRIELTAAQRAVLAVVGAAAFDRDNLSAGDAQRQNMAGTRRLTNATREINDGHFHWGPYSNQRVGDAVLHPGGCNVLA